MSRYARRVCLAVCMLLVLLSSLAAQTTSRESIEASLPRVVRITGKAFDSGQSPLQGRILMTFALYENQSTASPLWFEDQLVDLDIEGRYSVLLGATQAEGLPLALFSGGSARWLGVRVQGEEEQPRIGLAAVPYALKAMEAETFGGMPPSAYVLANAVNSSFARAVSSDHPAGLVLKNGGSSSTASVATSKSNKGSSGSPSDFHFSLYADDSGNVGIGTTSPAAKLDVTTTSNEALFLTRSSSDGTEAVQRFRKARGSSIVQNGDGVGSILFNGWNGTSYDPVAQIKALVDGTPGSSGDMPGRLLFLTNADGSASLSEAMRIESSGEVGIGSALPGQRLVVQDDSSYTAVNIWNNRPSLSAGTSAILFGLTDNSSFDTSSAASVEARRTSSTSAGLDIKAYNSGSLGTVMTFLGNGKKVGINETNPQKMLHVKDTSADTDLLRLEDSDFTCDANPESGSPVWTCSSDLKLKENVRDAPSALKFLRDIAVRQFEVRSNGKTTIGVIAQELQEVHPEMVKVDEKFDENGNKVDATLMTQPNIWLLVKAIQELAAKIEQ